MALLRAVLDGCSTTGRSLTPALGSFCGFGGRAALLSQERGFKKSLRKVDICLLKDVEGLGRDGQVVTVKPGRARNHLVPGKMAAYASPERLAQAEKKRAKWEVVEVVDSGLETAIKEATSAVNTLTKSTLVVKRLPSKETKQPRLPVTAELLVAEILRQRKLEVDVRMLRMDQGPLSTYGEHTIPLWIDKTLVPQQLSLTVKVENKR